MSINPTHREQLVTLRGAGDCRQTHRRFDDGFLFYAGLFRH